MMKALVYSCDCICVDRLIGLISSIYYKFRRPPNLPESVLFNREGLIAARPSVIIVSGGKLESLDFEESENTLSIINDSFKIRSHLTKCLFQRYFLVVVVGCFIGLNGILYDFIVNSVNCMKNSYLRSVFVSDYDNGTYYAYLWGAIINGGIALFGSFIIVFIGPMASGGGVANVLAYLNGVYVPGLVSFKTYCVKIVSLLCMGSSNLPGGKEGPLIHIGAISGSMIAKCRIPFTRIRLFPFMTSDAEIRDLSCCGTAAGLSAAFGTAIGSSLMTLEEYVTFWSGDLVFKIFLCSIVSAMTYEYCLSWVKDKHGTMSASSMLFINELFDEHLAEFSFAELPIFMFVGLVTGLLGSFWIFIHKLGILFRRKYVRWKTIRMLEVTMHAVLITSVNTLLLSTVDECSEIPGVPDNIFFLCSSAYSSYNMQLNCPAGKMASLSGYTFQGTDKVMEFLLIEEQDFYPLKSIASMFISFYFISSIFGGCSITHGLFVPGMVAGAMAGRLISVLCMLLIKAKDMRWALGVRLAYFGSAGLLGSITRLCFSLAVIYCEGASNVILFFPLFVVLVTVKLVSDILIDGVYEIQSAMANVPVLSKYPPPLGIGLNAADVMSRNSVVFLTTNSTVRRLIQVAFETRFNGFPIVDTRFTSRSDNDAVPGSVGRLVGLILRSQILVILKNQWFDNPNTPEAARKRLAVFRKDFADLLPRDNNTDKHGMNLDASVNLESYMDLSPYSVKASTSLNRTYKIFCLGLRHLVVVNNSNEVIGMITRKDLARYRTKYSLFGYRTHIMNNF